MLATLSTRGWGVRCMRSRDCYILNCLLPNFCVKALTLDMAVFENRPYEELIKVR
jgi:hypothetical protein